MLRKTLLGIALIFPLAGGLTACDEQGPMEETGEELDQDAEDIGDAVDGEGPAEETGEDIDDALGN